MDINSCCQERDCLCDFWESLKQDLVSLETLQLPQQVQMFRATDPQLAYVLRPVLDELNRREAGQSDDPIVIGLDTEWRCVDDEGQFAGKIGKIRTVQIAMEVPESRIL